MRKNTIRDIIPPERSRRPRTPAEHAEAEGERGERMPPERPRRSQKSARRHMPWIKVGGAAIVAVIIVSVAFSFFFSGARVTVIPRTETVNVDGSFTAYAENAADLGALTYQSMTVERTLAETVTASGEERVEERASGQITVYNDYNTEPQRLIKNTRFETPDGLIYRINDSITVPGQREADGELAPGSITVTVYADSPGEEYNIGLADFTIPGFEGAPQYEDFYARSETPMTGGFVGTRPSVAPLVLERTTASLEERLGEQLRADALAQAPAGFVIFPDATFIEYTYPPRTPRGTGEVEVSVRGVLHGILLPEDALAELIAEHTVPTYKGEPLSLAGAEELRFTILETAESARPWEAKEVPFSLQGGVTLVWDFDRDGLKQDLMGREKGAIHTILSGYAGIERAEVVVRPFWKSTFPEDPDDLTITVRAASP